MTLHDSTFQYLKPTDEQQKTMALLRSDFAKLGEAVEHALPDGPDKTVVQRKIREAAMWANVSITRNPDGSPRV